jgi:hypothetical protein
MKSIVNFSKIIITMALHKIQRFILAQLSEHDSRRYRDMKPASMESSQFMYHLKQLQSLGLVSKLAAGTYSLSVEGWLYVDRADSGLNLRNQPRIGAMMICRHPKLGLLYMRRGVQPARGYIGFPIIDIPVDMAVSLRKYCEQSLKTMTGVTATAEHRADGYINLETGSQRAGSLLAHVFEAEYRSGKITSHPLFDFCWQSELPAADTKKILESSTYVLNQLERRRDGFFFFEHSFSLGAAGDRRNS